MMEFCRILVPYECWTGVESGTRALPPPLGRGVATTGSMAHWTLMVRMIDYNRGLDQRQRVMWGGKYLKKELYSGGEEKGKLRWE